MKICRDSVFLNGVSGDADKDGRALNFSDLKTSGRYRESALKMESLSFKTTTFCYGVLEHKSGYEQQELVEASGERYRKYLMIVELAQMF